MSRSAAKTACLVAALALIAWLLMPGSGHRILELLNHLRFVVLLAAGFAAGWGLYLWLGRVPLREKLVRCVLMTGSLLVALGLVEATAVLGLVNYSGILPGGGRIPVGYSSLSPKWWRLDPELIHVRHPHQQIRGETSGDIRSVPDSEKHIYRIDAAYDANGFRNGSDLARAALVLIGDSFVEAGLVPEHATTAATLRRKLGTEVANLGVTMYGPQQELAVLRRFGLPLGPRVVLWFFFEGNDLEDAVRYEDHRRAVQRLLMQRSTWYSRYVQRSFLINVNHLFGDWIRLHPRASRPFARSCEIVAGGERRLLYFRYGGDPLGPTTDEGLDRTRRIIESAHDLATGRGARFSLVYVPTKFRVYRDRCSNAGEQAFPPEWRFDDLPKQFLAWSREQGIPFLDLTPVLQARAEADGLLYFADDSHWTPLGNQRVAEAILEFLTERVWVERGDDGNFRLTGSVN